MEQTKIYLTCFPGGFKAGDVIGYALAEDGQGLASHLSSNIEYSKHDMGLTSNWKHDHYAKIFPFGYKLIWIDNPDTDDRWLAAVERNQEIEEKKKETEANLEKEGFSVKITMKEEKDG